MAKVIIYSTAYCPYCVQAKKLLERKGITYTEIRVDENEEKRDEMIRKSQRQTVPQIFINDSHVGGFDDLYALEQQKRLDDLLNS